MDFTQIIDADDLSPAFIDYIKAEFRSKKIKISVEVEPEPTEYLMSSLVNHKRLLKSIKNIEKGKKLLKL